MRSVCGSTTVAIRSVRQAHAKRLKTARLGRANELRCLQILAHRLAIAACVTGDRRDRPAPARKRVNLHIVLLRQHPQRLPSVVVASNTATLEGAPDRIAPAPARSASPTARLREQPLLHAQGGEFP